MKAFLESDAFGALSSLDIQGNPLGRDGGEAFATNTHVNSLRHLWINNIGDAGVVALSTSSSLERLESLALGFLKGELSEDAVISLANSNVTANLRSLSLTGAVTDVGVKSIAKSTMTGNLRRLSLSGDISGEGIEALAVSERLSGLWQLKLDLCPIGDRGASAIANSDSLRNLIDLQIAFCKLTENGSRILAQSDNVRSLRWISLNRELIRPWLDSPNTSEVLKARVRAIESAGHTGES
ncbi:MAG: hypothetical protein R3C18_10135 [Planctomycetaceae bacterium]